MTCEAQKSRFIPYLWHLTASGREVSQKSHDTEDSETFIVDISMGCCVRNVKSSLQESWKSPLFNALKISFWT
jgi:hypothetical protein